MRSSYNTFIFWRVQFLVAWCCKQAKLLDLGFQREEIDYSSLQSSSTLMVWWAMSTTEVLRLSSSMVLLAETGRKGFSGITFYMLATCPFVVIFRQYGASLHYKNLVRQYLDDKLPHVWIWRVRTSLLAYWVPWLQAYDFFRCANLNDTVFFELLQNVPDLSKKCSNLLPALSSKYEWKSISRLMNTFWRVETLQNVFINLENRSSFIFRRSESS